MKFQDVFKQELGWVLPCGGLADSQYPAFPQGGRSFACINSYLRFFKSVLLCVPHSALHTVGAQ